jgi:hypothetical protein
MTADIRMCEYVALPQLISACVSMLLCPGQIIQSCCLLPEACQLDLTRAASALAAAEEDVRTKMGWQYHGELHSETEVAFYATGLGTTYAFFETHAYHQMFYRMGIHPETAFGCALRPTQPVHHLTL